MATTTTSPPRIIGCDVGKDSIIVAERTAGHTATIDNRPDRLAAFVKTLGHDCLLVCEATGGHETALLLAATDAGIPAHRADARKVKAFIRSLGRIAKTDRIDAHGLARYGRDRHAELPRWQPAAGVLDDLRTLVRLRTQLVKQRAGLRSQLKAPTGRIAKQRLQAMIDHITDHIAGIAADIEELLGRDPAVAKVVAIVEDIPGCGHLTALTVAALMPELGSMTGRQAASLAGLAPHPHQSGQRDGRRRVRGGRPEVKRALFMAAMAARNHNPTLKPVYERLVRNGKTPLVALTAIMRKLITIINARVRDAHQQPTPELS